MLTNEDRDRVWRGFMRYLSANLSATGDLSKHDLRDAVSNTDTWIESNQASYNTALPQPARDGLTAAQKTLLFCAVALARVSIAALRKIFGEVN